MPRLKSRSDLLAGTSRISFAGSLTQEQMAQQFRQANLFVLATMREEGFPLVISESLASGIPVIATRVGGNPTAVRDGIDGLLVRPGSAPALAKAVTRLAEDVELRSRMAQNARARALAVLDVDVVAAQVEQVLYEAVGARQHS